MANEFDVFAIVFIAGWQYVVYIPAQPTRSTASLAKTLRARHLEADGDRFSTHFLREVPTPPVGRRGLFRISKLFLGK